MPSTPIPLPHSPPQRVLHSSDAHTHVSSAYEILLRIEEQLKEELDSAPTKNEKDESEQNLIYCRIIGWFFHHVPTDQGLKHLVDEVVSCERYDDSLKRLLEMGKFYYDHIIRIFRSAKGRTPTQSHHSSRSSFNTLADMIRTKLKETSLNHATAKERALIRDGFRCVITGDYNYDSINTFDELLLEASTMEKPSLAVTQCVHIISESINFGISKDQTKTDYAASARAFLSWFGCDDILDELNGPQVHRLENVMTLEPNVYSLFNKLELFLETTDIKHQYEVRAFNLLVQKLYSKTVTLTTSDPTLPLPSGEYLAIHAACAKVAHDSGAAEYIDRVSKDLDEAFVLAKDGTSAAVLDHALRAAFINPISNVSQAESISRGVVS